MTETLQEKMDTIIINVAVGHFSMDEGLGLANKAIRELLEQINRRSTFSQPGTNDSTVLTIAKQDVLALIGGVPRTASS